MTTETPDTSSPDTSPPACTSGVDPLKEVRARLDELDDRIVALLAERYALLHEVVELKKVHNLSHRIPARVEAVLARNEARGIALGLPEGYIRRLYTLIIDESHRFELKKLGH